MPSFHFLDADDADLSKLLYPTGYNLSISDKAKKRVRTNAPVYKLYELYSIKSLSLWLEHF